MGYPAPAPLNFVAYAGGVFNPGKMRWFNPDGTPFDLTGWAGRGQVRTSYEPGAALVLDYTAYITVDEDDDGTYVEIVAPPSVTAGWHEKTGEYVHGMELYLVGSETTVKFPAVVGAFAIRPDMVRDE